jgi:hypothetical protein
MKRLTTACLLFLYVFASTELHQFIHLPSLVGHYVEHRSNNPSISLAGFIASHYFSGDTQADYAKHQSLPFKNHNCPEASIAMAMPPADLEAVVFRSYVADREPLAPKPLGKAQRYHISIWQPPR